MCTAMMAGFGGWGGYGMALLVGTAAAAALAVLAVALLARQLRPAVARRPEDPAIAVLKERLARGEIDPEEFERRLFALLTHESLR